MKKSTKKVIIFGVGGFIGSHLAEKLLKQGYVVYGFDIIKLNKSKNLELIANNKNFKYTKGNINNKSDVRKVFKHKVDVVYHLASIVGVRKYIDNPLSVIETIVLGSKNVIDMCVKNKTRILFSSTSEIYGDNPLTPWAETSNRVLGDPSIDRWSYSTSKSLVEHMLFALYKSKKINFSTVRFFNVYGPRQNPIYVVSQSVYRVLRNERPDIYDGGNMTRCFTYIDDVIDGIILAANKKSAIGHVFNLGYQSPSKMKDIVKLCIKLSNKKIKPKSINTKKLYGSKYQDIINRIPNSNKAKKLLGWKAKTNPTEGIKKLIHWISLNDWYIEK